MAGDSKRPIMQFHSCTIPPEETAANRAAVVAAFDAIAAGDRGPFQALWDPEITFHEADSLPYGGAHHGVEAVLKAHGQLHETFDQMTPVVEQLAAAGDLVIAYISLTFRVRRNGRGATMPVAELVRFRNGRITEWRAIYFDAALVAGLIAAD